jgi:hypothetical protein
VKSRIRARPYRLALPLLVIALGCAGYKSPGITLNVMNDSGAVIHNIEIDFPGGSYGIASLRAGERRSRWVRLIGSAPLKIDFVDDRNQSHSANLIDLHAGENGSVGIHVRKGGTVSVDDLRSK